MQRTRLPASSSLTEKFAPQEHCTMIATAASVKACHWILRRRQIRKANETFTKSSPAAPPTALEWWGRCICYWLQKQSEAPHRQPPRSTFR